MKYFIYITFALVLSAGCSALAQQKYRSHTVEKGETIYSISKKYNTTEAEIYRLNPDAKNGVRINSILIIPSGDVINTESTEVKLKKHRVKRKETLFSISQRYQVSIDDIKKYNKELYSRQIKKGERINIPIGLKNTTTTVVNTNNETSTSSGAKHTVQPKETKYGIARKYGITIAELEKLNPNIGEGLPMGTVLDVPDTAVTPTATIEENFDFYEVQAKEGFFRLKVKLGLSEEEIIDLNPYAKDGLKEGMILKIPKKNLSPSGNVLSVNLEDRIMNTELKNLVVMLPFQLNRFNSDTTNTNADVLKQKRSNAVRVALDFYSGVLMAAEFAKDKGISVNIDVFDTEASDRKVNSIISGKDFKEVDAVIGPLLSANVEKAVAMLKGSDTPVFSPLSNREIKSSSNLFQTLPTDGMLEEAMLEYLETHALDKNVILISDAKRIKQKNAVLSKLPHTKAVSPREKGFLYVGDIDSKIDKGRDNWVILESDDPVIISNVVVLLNGMPDEYNLRLFTLDKNAAYDYHDVSNMHLAKLRFTFPSINKSYDFNDRNPFLVSYKNKYGVLPNRFAVRGFDITYDILLKLASADNIYEATDSDYETEYIENKFHYTKKMFKGYQNNALYIIKYNEKLQLEVAE